MSEPQLADADKEHAAFVAWVNSKGFGLEVGKETSLSIVTLILLDILYEQQQEIERLKERATANAEVERLRGALREIIQNAPVNEPTVVTPQTLPIAYSYWVARAIAIKAMQGD